MHAHIYSTVYHYSTTTTTFTDYPTLASLARQVFSVPATSAPVEHVFSQAGKIHKSTTMLHNSNELWNTAIFEDEFPVYVTLMQL